MVAKWIHRWALLLVVVLLTMPAVGQKNAFARVSVSPREGVVRQPFKVSISVYSSTWFTAGLQFSNLRVEDAFIIPFTRTVSSVQYIDKKQYSTLTFYYLVFPYHSGDLEIPEITITASIPPEGGYKGEPVTIVTKAQKITVDELPKTKEAEPWMVASGATIEQQWNKSLNNLKVGDVIERSIKITAYGTLPSLIAPLDLLEPRDVSLYPSAPVLKDLRTGEAVNGRRTQTYSYLFEKEGEVVIPDESILWWNPKAKRVYKKVLAGQTLMIAPNPDLAMMQSVKDSLEAISAPSNLTLGEEDVNWKRSVLIAVLILLSFWIVFRMTKRELHRAIEKRHAYLHSERYYYKRVRSRVKNQDSRAFINDLYAWFDLYRLPNSDANITDYLTQEDRVYFERYLEGLFKDNVSIVPIDKRKTLLLLKRLRWRLNASDTKIDNSQLNP